VTADPKRQPASNGHDAAARHGRFAVERAPELVSAMLRLLDSGSTNPTSRYTAVDGGVIHYLETGSGRPLVLLHGASGGGANWFRVLRRFSEIRRVLAPDLPGFGLSAAIDARAPLGKTVAAVVLRWLDRVGVETFDVAGTSFGGLVSLRLAQMAADRVRSLTLIDAVGLGRSYPLLLRLVMLPPFAPLVLRASRRGTEWQLEHLFIDDRHAIPPPMWDALVEYLYQSSRCADVSKLARGFSLFSDLRGQREVLTPDELRALRVPTLILWGERDRFVPASHGRRAAALVPHSEFRIIPRAGHSPNWEAPDDVAAAMVSFLQREPAV